MKRTLILSAILLIYFDMFGQDQSSKPEALFDFWLGKWSASWDEGDGKRGEGTNHIHRIMDGTGLQENFEITKGQNAGFKGMSISTYHTQSETWKQCWTDSQRGFYYFLGKEDGDKRIFQTEVKSLPDGREITQRMVFYDIQEKTMTWDWESSTDGGETWTLNWRIDYAKLE